jgi:hypothetical protein
MKQMLILFFIVLMVSTPVISGTAHTVTGRVFNHNASVPADGSITFNAYITSRPGEVQTQSSTGAGYSGGNWFIGTGNFPTAWSVGDVLHVGFTNTVNGENGSVNVTLTSGDPDYASDVTLAPIQYQLTMTVSPAGGGTTTPAVGAHTYDNGTVVNISATPAAGYQFVSWSGGVADPNSASTTVTMSGNKTVTANFRTTYDLTMAVSPAGAGTTTPSVGVYTYDSGTVINVSLTPSPGYRFVNWTGGVADPNSASTTVTLDNNKTVTAHFLKTYKLTIAVSPAGGGTTTPAQGVQTYEDGSIVNITATANPGYIFSNWTGGVADSNSASTTVTINGDKTVTANFVRGYTLTMAMNPAGSGTAVPSIGNHNYTIGLLVNISVTPVAGYRFVNWTGGVADSNSASTTVTMNANKSVTANLKKTYGLTMAVNPIGGGTTTPVVGAHTYDDGSALNISAASAVGYHFANWTGGVADSTSVSTMLTLNNNKIVTANFGFMFMLVIDSSQYAENVTISPLKTIYFPGEKVVLTAYAKSNYTFIRWSGDGSGTDHQLEIIMNKDKTVHALFGSPAGVNNNTINGVPSDFNLLQNYPNPFNPTTTITFTLAKNDHVSLKVFDIFGREMATLVNAHLNAGVVHHAVLNASQFSTGMYFYRLEAGKNVQVKKLMLLK